ncbi:Uncharacterised protein [Actinobacillus pleuropneumoniae]|nr:Uncharacterised protein [Actinobacillus pleuropneumoniae]
MLTQHIRDALASRLSISFPDISLISKEDAVPIPEPPYFQTELTLAESSRYRPVDMRLVFVSRSITFRLLGSRWQRSWMRCWKA